MWIINSCDSCFCRSAPVQGATTAVVPILSGAVASLECNISPLVWELLFYVERDSQMLTVSGSFCIYRYVLIMCVYTSWLVLRQLGAPQRGHNNLWFSRTLWTTSAHKHGCAVVFGAISGTSQAWLDFIDGGRALYISQIHAST